MGKIGKIYGILPMAGRGQRLQPIGFSKELYPVVHKNKHYAIADFSIRAMERAGVDEIKLVVNPDKLDIAKYYSNYHKKLSIYFYSSRSLPESCLYPIESLHDEDICLFGLPDTLFAPSIGYQKIVTSLKIKEVGICLGLFQVSDASKYDSVKFDKNMRVIEVRVKKKPPCSNYVWGIWGAKVWALKKLKKEINNQKRQGERLLGVGFNKVAQKKIVKVICNIIGNDYFDIGTIDAVIQAKSISNSRDFTI